MLHSEETPSFFEFTVLFSEYSLDGRTDELTPKDARPGQARPGQARPGQARPGQARAVRPEVAQRASRGLVGPCAKNGWGNCMLARPQQRSRKRGEIHYVFNPRPWLPTPLSSSRWEERGSGGLASSKRPGRVPRPPALAVLLDRQGIPWRSF